MSAHPSSSLPFLGKHTNLQDYQKALRDFEEVKKVEFGRSRAGQLDEAALSKLAESQMRLTETMAGLYRQGQVAELSGAGERDGPQGASKKE